MINYYNTNISDYDVSEKEKREKDYLIAMTDSIIAELVLEGGSRRMKMGKMRDLYDGIRDPREYAYLTENFGIGNASDIKFTPVVRNRIDALIGLLSSVTFDYSVNVMDIDSLEFMRNEKLVSYLEEIYSMMLDHQRSQQEGIKPNVPPAVKAKIKEAKRKVSKKWKSILVQSCNNMIEYFRTDVDMDLLEKRKLLFEDLLVVGECVYNVFPKYINQPAELEVYLPENYYTKLTRDKKYFKEARKSVYVRYLTREEVLNRFGHLMDEQDMKDLFSMQTVSRSHAIKSARELERVRDSKEKHWEDTDIEFYQIYETQWIANNSYKINKQHIKKMLPVDGPDKVNSEAYKECLFRSIRIGTDIYLEMGEVRNIPRSRRNPDSCNLTTNGTRYSSRNGEAYSLTWKCKDVQDSFDVLTYLRDNLISNSGVKGSRINFAAIPQFLGTDPMERLMKFIALKKQGSEVYDGSMEGAQAFSHYGDFDNSIDGQGLQAIDAVLDRIDMAATMFTGITPQMLGMIEQREAVGNVKTGLTNTSLVLKNLFDQNDNITKHLLTDLIRNAQVAVKNDGFIGSFISTRGQEIFKILPEEFCNSDYNLHVISTSDEFNKVVEFKSAIKDLIAVNAIDPLILIKIMKSDSLNEISDILEEALEEGKSDAGALNELQQNLEDLQKENQKLQQELENVNKHKSDLDEKKFGLDQTKVQKELELKEKDMLNRKDFNDKTLEYKKEVVNLERDQLHLEAGAGQAKEVKNNLI